MTKKQQFLALFAEQLLLHKDLPDIRTMCSALSVTIDEYAGLVMQCSTEEMNSVFSVLTPIVLMNIFHQTSDTISAQKLWSELFLKSTAMTHSAEENSVVVHFVDDNPKEVTPPSALEEVLKLHTTP